jgi:biopolymer transport protein ExbB
VVNTIGLQEIRNVKMRISLKQMPRGFSLPKVIIAMALVLIIRVVALAQDAPAAQPAATQAATDAPESNTVPALSPLDLFKKAGYFIWPLAACSVLSVTLIIERFIALRRSRVIPPGLLAGLKAVYQDPKEDRERGIQYCEQHDSPLSRMLLAGIRRLPRGYAAAEKAIEDAGGNETLKLRQNMRLLYSLGNVATLLGLIGTIAGMIKAFQVASVMGPGHADKLSEGIYEAMVNTFGGLAIAIVVTLFYYLFIGKIEKLVSEMNDAVNEFGRDLGFDASPDAEVAATATL